MNKINMIDITQKISTTRTAVATGKIFFSRKVFLAIKNKKLSKGNPLEVAKISGILASKNVAQTIPLTHPINITHCNIEIVLNNKKNKFFAQVITTIKLISKTGPDIEAMYATSVALLTIYDMIKPIDPSAIISEIKLVQKTGGKSNYNINK